MECTSQIIFDEDTLDGKNTLHATATAAFQFRDASEPEAKAILDIKEPANEKSLSSAMCPTLPQLVPCNTRSQQTPRCITKYVPFATEQNPQIIQ